MKLKTKGRYAVTAMLDVALHQEEGPVSLIGISLRQNISQSYLEQLFAQLRKKDLVESVRGPGGGYRIKKPCDQVSVDAIIKAIDYQSLDATNCKGLESCRPGKACLTHQLWQDLTEVIDNYLSQVTLMDLVNQHAKKESE